MLWQGNVFLSRMNKQRAEGAQGLQPLIEFAVKSSMRYENVIDTGIYKAVWIFVKSRQAAVFTKIVVVDFIK